MTKIDWKKAGDYVSDPARVIDIDGGKEYLANSISKPNLKAVGAEQKRKKLLKEDRIKKSTLKKLEADIGQKNFSTVQDMPVLLKRKISLKSTNRNSKIPTTPKSTPSNIGKKTRRSSKNGNIKSEDENIQNNQSRSWNKMEISIIETEWKKGTFAKNIASLLKGRTPADIINYAKKRRLPPRGL